jgi:hypothetical protein
VNPFDEVLDKLGLKDPAHRAEITLQIQLLAIESALAELLRKGNLTDDDKAAIKRISETKTVDGPAVQQLFGSPERQAILNVAMTGALKVASGH